MPPSAFEHGDNVAQCRRDRDARGVRRVIATVDALTVRVAPLERERADYSVFRREQWAWLGEPRVGRVFFVKDRLHLGDAGELDLEFVALRAHLFTQGVHVGAETLTFVLEPQKFCANGIGLRHGALILGPARYDHKLVNTDDQLFLVSENREQWHGVGATGVPTVTAASACS
jgi:hypothetical protein